MITGRQCAEAAEAVLDKHPPITYQQEDCQAFIEQTVKRAGGSMKDYRGSNDMLRNACTKVLPLNQATLEPGMLLFIVRHDGKEPPQYQDSLGNAVHVGWYTGGRYEVVHSSQSMGLVAPSTLKNGWTHAGWAKELTYGNSPVNNPANGPAEPTAGIGYIDLPPDKNVFHRISPDRGSKWWGRINGGEQVEIISRDNNWVRARYGGHDGYIASEFVIYDAPGPSPEQQYQDALLTEIEGHLNRLLVLVGTLRGGG